MKQSNILKNIVMLYGFSIAKIVFPLITLPYLTRVLSVEKYGVVAYVKSIMTYMQLLIDFGFMLSGTKEIVQKKENIKELYNAIGDILIARIILCAVSFLVLLVLTIVLPILRKNFIYTFLTFIPIVMTVFLFDYVFRGLEKMQIISSRFILMKGFSTAVTFFLVKSDADLMVIPILEIIGSSLAIILVYYELKKYKLCICFSGIISAITKLKISAVYFASNIATTVGGALSTVLIGAFMNSSDIAYWSAALQLLNAVLAMYNPIVDGIYPSVIQSHDYRIIKKIAVIFMPLIICGCMIILFCSDWIVTLIYGEEYFNSAMIL
ncbi:MAG: oligosaccharide flippase family protein, partial [Firmicutes bacterium]|nr:oligosaccharide flippase family protein [Bacillota bacterium]